MDPISAAGIGLSVTSLALQLFAGCIQGYQIFLDAAGMPENFEHLRVRMRVEQVRLLNWGESIGLLEDLLDTPSVTLQLHRNLIIDILLEIQRLFKGCLKIEEKFGSSALLEEVPSPNSATQRLHPSPQKGTNTLLTKTLRALEKGAQVPKRLQWAMVKHERFEKLIEKLISYNDSIVSLLDRASIDQLQEMQIQTQLAMLQLSSKIDDLKQLSLAMLVKTDTDTHTSYTHRSTWNTRSISASQISGGTSLSLLATFKAEQISIETYASAGRPEPVDRKLVTLVNTSSNRSQGSYKGERIWIEWKEWDPNHQLPTWDIMIEDRIKKLAALLGLDNTPKEFRAPTCLGFFEDRDDDTARYGLIYRQPQEIPATAEPVSLLHLIRTSPKPTLTQRAALAHIVAQSLMYLHSVNWLHKGFRSDSIVFFTTPNEAPDYASPIISGFEYARPDLPEELTEKPCESFSHDLYRHPDALINPALRSKKSWDIYSLAIVLIEIAMWQGINDIVDIQEGQRGARTKLRKIREVLLEDKFLAALAGATGERYCNVVRRCLGGGLELGVEDGADESDPHIGVNMLQVVAVGVVGKLASIQT